MSARVKSGRRPRLYLLFAAALTNQLEEGDDGLDHNLEKVRYMSSNWKELSVVHTILTQSVGLVFAHSHDVDVA